jgi:hypothetical protein
VGGRRGGGEEDGAEGEERGEGEWESELRSEREEREREKRERERMLLMERIEAGVEEDRSASLRPCVSYVQKETKKEKKALTRSRRAAGAEERCLNSITAMNASTLQEHSSALLEP